jgi:hypothetical protein
MTRRYAVVEKFNEVGPFTLRNNVVAEVERDPKYGKQLGALWFDSGWFTVPEARELRAWLDKVIP